MRIHKAGYSVIFVAVLILALIDLIVFFASNGLLPFYISLMATGLLALFVVRFFRYPNRKITVAEGEIIAPADGTVVTIEEVENTEYVEGKRIQVSIFMSVWNVHINWIPVSGVIKTALHIDGSFVMARAPKSSDLNERTVTVIKPEQGETIVVKQIAGIVARRILTYIKEGDSVKSGDQLGFIRFGSRVDVLLPLDYEINVKLGQKTVGGITKLAQKKQ
ncbi:MAG: phosphatidylserine decarboxylase family protein [Salinivirgaceae bacterium]|nr:phosphatidylserine decarboxylase family protein [Salinivirgaceae bacterium]